MPKQYSALEEIRTLLSEKKSSSQTTLRYQADVFETMINCLEEGDCVIEIGVFKGGISCQLAFLLENTGKTLVLIDVVDEYLQWIQQLIQEIGIKTPVIYFTGTLEQFVNEYFQIKPSLIIVDADHKYKGVRDDIQSIKRMKYQPVAVVFHDLSLRYCRSKNALQVRVDKAIVDSYLMYGYKYKEIGALRLCKDVKEPLQGIINVSAEREDYHYHDKSYSEGMLVIINERKFKHCSPLEWKDLEVWFPNTSYRYFQRIKVTYLRILDYLICQRRYLHKLKCIIKKAKKMV